MDSFLAATSVIAGVPSSQYSIQRVGAKTFVAKERGFCVASAEHPALLPRIPPACPVGPLGR